MVALAAVHSSLSRTAQHSATPSRQSKYIVLRVRVELVVLVLVLVLVVVDVEVKKMWCRRYKVLR